MYLLRPDVDLQSPLPLPALVAVVDKAILLFGKIFPFLGSHKHRQQLLEHFIEVIRVAKGALRRQAVQVRLRYMRVLSIV